MVSVEARGFATDSSSMLIEGSMILDFADASAAVVAATDSRIGGDMARVSITGMAGVSAAAGSGAFSLTGSSSDSFAFTAGGSAAGGFSTAGAAAAAFAGALAALDALGALDALVPFPTAA